MPFVRRFPNSPYAITKTAASTPLDFAVKVDSIVGASVITSSTSRLYSTAGPLDVTATALEVLAVIDPQPTAPVLTPPVAEDVTGGKLRIKPGGGAIAFEQNSSRGKWLVIFVTSGNEVNYLYTDDVKNPEIGKTWRYLREI